MTQSGRIENSLKALAALGWSCDVYNFKIPQFSMHVDYDNKRLAINCPKAYHTAQMLDHVHDITTVETESLSEQKCVVRGAYVYSFIGLEVFEYTNPIDPEHPAFANLVLTGMPRSMYTGEFMPEDVKYELTSDIHTNAESDANVETGANRSVMHVEVEGEVSQEALAEVATAFANATVGYTSEKPTVPGTYQVRHIARADRPEDIGEEVNVWSVNGTLYVDLDPDGSCPVSSVHDGLEWLLLREAEAEETEAEDEQVSVCIRRSDSTIVTADDAPGNGGAHHHYSVSTNPGWGISTVMATLNFQNGGVAEVGINGIQIEDLLAISAHRLQCFQAGPFACIQNQSALESINHALATLDARTAERKARNVEGKQVE